MTKEGPADGTVTLAAMSPEFAGLAEVAEMLLVTKRTAFSYTQRPDFPPPLERLAATPIWRRVDVEEWAKANLPLPTGRPPRPQA